MGIGLGIFRGTISWRKGQREFSGTFCGSAKGRRNFPGAIFEVELGFGILRWSFCTGNDAPEFSEGDFWSARAARNSSDPLPRVSLNRIAGVGVSDQGLADRLARRFGGPLRLGKSRADGCRGVLRGERRRAETCCVADARRELSASPCGGSFSTEWEFAGACGAKRCSPNPARIAARRRIRCGWLLLVVAALRNRRENPARIAAGLSWPCNVALQEAPSR